MSKFRQNRRALALIAVLVPLLAAFVYVAVRSGPLAPVPVTVAQVESRALATALFGIGTVEARYTHKVGPTFAGRVARVLVEPGERIAVGQLLAEMDPVDFDQRIAAQEAALQRAQAAVLAAEAQVREAETHQHFTAKQAMRYEELTRAGSASDENAEARRQEAQAAEAAFASAQAGLAVARGESARVAAERDALVRQRANLRLVAPAAGLVTARNAEVGTTVVAGQSVIEVVDPSSLWINARFDQLRAGGLRAGLSASVALRSRQEHAVAGKILRIEPVADTVTEEILAKVSFDALPDPLPPIGELVEVTVELPKLAALPVVPGASIHRRAGTLGVWRVDGHAPRFTPVALGAGDLDGAVQVVAGLDPGTNVVVHSQRVLDAGARLAIVRQIPGVTP